VFVFWLIAGYCYCCCCCCPLQTDTLSELARKKGISMRNATKQDLVAQLSRVLKTSDLSKGQVRGVYGAGGRVMIGGRASCWRW
jgi:hypothetical protein